MKLLLSSIVYLLFAGIAFASEMDHSNHANHMHGTPSSLESVTFLILLSTGFFTGLSHCVGMCGPIVSAFSAQQKQIHGTVTFPLLIYQVGRISTYVILGVILAAIGSSLQLAAIGQGWQVGLSIFIGLVMLFIALNLMGVLSGLRWLESAILAKWVGQRISQLMQSSHPAAPFGLGMANGMLPCGPVYAMALLAATASSPVQGGLIMLTFGIGTLPAMLSMGYLFAKLSVSFRKRLFRFAALLILLVGLQQILRGLALAGILNHLHIGSVMIW